MAAVRALHGSPAWEMYPESSFRIRMLTSQSKYMTIIPRRRIWIWILVSVQSSGHDRVRSHSVIGGFNNCLFVVVGFSAQRTLATAVDGICFWCLFQLLLLTQAPVHLYTILTLICTLTGSITSINWIILDRGERERKKTKKTRQEDELKIPTNSILLLH